MANAAPRRTDRISELLCSASTSILWIGSGDGSQQASVVRSGHTKNCATFYDSRAQVLRKYPSAAENLAVLERADVEQHFSIDVAILGRDTSPLGRTRRFDIVVFYFPHVGGDTNRPEILASNRVLIRQFLDGATRVLAPGGEIHLAVKTGGSYDRWNVSELFAEREQISLVQQLPVDRSQFPGYAHRLTSGGNGPLAEVRDEGAQVYILKFDRGGTEDSAVEEEENIFDRLNELNARILVSETRTFVAMTDADVEGKMREALEENRGKTVLEWI